MGGVVEAEVEVTVEVVMEEVHHVTEVGRPATPAMNEDILQGTANMDADLEMDNADHMAGHLMVQGEEGEQFFVILSLKEFE